MPDIVFSDVLPKRCDVGSVLFCISMTTRNGYEIFVHDLKITAEESKLRNRHNVKPEDIDRMAAEWEDWEE